MADNHYECHPNTAWLTVNHACNLRCVWCYNEGTRYIEKNQMPVKLAKRLVDIGLEVGIDRFILIGGEPTLWDGMFEIISYCHSRSTRVGIVTNVVRFSDDDFWEKYMRNPCDEISISVKSVDSDEFYNATGSRNFQKSLLGIERVINFHNTGVTTVLNSMVGLDELKNIGKACKNLGAKSIIVNMCSPTIDSDGRVQDNYTIPKESLARITIEAVEYLESLFDDAVEMDIQMPLCLFPEDFVEKYIGTGRIQTLCQLFARSGVNFSVNGNISVCNELADTAIAKLDIDFHDGISLLNHLNTPLMCSNYKQLLRYPSECCSDCRWQNECRGGCILNWLVYDPEICHAVTPEGR